MNKATKKDFLVVDLPAAKLYSLFANYARFYL